MAEQSNRLSNDWVRCKSKSRTNRFYIFNKKTGETKWCSDAESNIHLKIVSDVLKTPAQDRMKRLQNQLEKKRLKEAAADSTKSGWRAKKGEKKDSARKNSSPSKKASPVGSNKVAESQSLLAASSKSSTVPKRLTFGSSEKRKDGESIQKIAANVPPRRGKNQTVPSVHPPSKPNDTQSKNSKSNEPIKESKEKTSLAEQCSESPPKSVEKNAVPVESVPIEYDENKNQKQSQEKGGFLSVLYNFINGGSKASKHKKADKKDKEKLSGASKTSFKHKKSDNKKLLRGISSEIQTESIQTSPKNLSKVVQHIPVTKENANDRLERLRKSLRHQQSLQIPAPTLCLVPDVYVPDACTSSPNVSECEPMDWQPILENFNDSISSPSTSSGIVADSFTVSEHNDTVNLNITRLVAAQKQSKDWKRDHFHFIVDTNVFIEHPTFVEELTTMKLCDTMGTVIYVPYCVLQELDKLKIRSPSESIRIRTSRAIKFLNKAFEGKHPQFQAQSAADEADHLIKVTSPDDSILNCCLQVKQHVDNLLLLTEDVNLQSKAMCNDILVSTKSDLISLH